MRGLRNKDEQILQFLKESTPGVFPGGAQPLICVNTKHTWDADDTDDEFGPDGYNDDAWSARIETKTKLDITECPFYYNLVDEQFLQYLFGVPQGTFDSTAGGVRTREYRWPQTGRRDIPTFAAQYGTPDECRQALMGFLTSWSVESKAGQGGTTRGKASAILQGFTEGNVLAGATARNHVIKITIDGATGNGTFTVPAPAGGAGGGTLTVALGQTAAQVLTNLKALPGYNDAGVSATGSSAGASAGAAANPTVATTLVSVGGTGNFQPGTYRFAKSYVTASGETAIGPIQVHNETGNPGYFQLGQVPGETPPANVTGINVYMSDAVNSTTLRFLGTMGTGSNPNFVAFPAANAAIAPTTNSTGSLGGTGSYTITLGGALGNKLQAGWGTSSTGYSVAPIIYGSNGVSVIAEPTPVLPQHWGIFRADTLAGLSQAANMVRTAPTWNIDLADIALEWNAHNRSLTYADIVQQKGTRGLSLTLPTDFGDHCSAMLDNAKPGAGRYINKAQWFRFHALSPVGPFEWIIDIYASVRGSIPIRYNRNVEEREFPLKSQINLAEGYNFRMITKTPA